jgi:hypothetical protein
MKENIMHKTEIVIKNKNVSKIIKMGQLEIGDIGYMDYEGTTHLILCHYNGVVSLTNPVKAWTRPFNNATNLVELVDKVEIITS